MSNRFLNATEYANTMLLLTKNALVMGKLVSGTFKNEVTDENGLRINVKRPSQFIATDGANLQEQFMLTGSVDISVTEYKGVHIGVGDIEYVSSFNELLRNQTMLSAASTLAHAIDSHLMLQTQSFYGTAGSPGTNIDTNAKLLAAHTQLMDQMTPNDQLSGVLTWADSERVRGNLVTSSIDGVNRTALEKSRLPVVSEIDWYATQQIRSIVCGTRAASGAATVAGANQNVNYRTANVADTYTQTLNLAGLAAGATIRRGETFTIAGVNEFNWRTGQVLPDLQRFTVTADATANGSGAVTVTISPPIIVPATNDGVDTRANTAFATVSAAPANGAAVTFDGAANAVLPIRSAFHKTAIQMVSARLQTPFTGESSFATDPETGISIRYWRGSDIQTGRHIHRWDTIFGARATDPRLGTRVYG